jgi:hypothetical protein
LQIPHPVNMTSLTAFGLFSGAKLSPMVAASLCLVLMVVTDLLLGWIQVGAAWNTQREFNAFGSWTAFTYVAFAIDVVIGHKLARRTENPGYIGLAALLGATQFFVISNFGVWATEYGSHHSTFAHFAMSNLLFSSFLCAGACTPTTLLV